MYVSSAVQRLATTAFAPASRNDLSPEERLVREAKTWLDRQVIAQECEWEPDHDLRLVIENPFMRGASGKLDAPAPVNLFSLELPGSQGSHPGHSCILHGDPETPDSGRFSQTDFDRLLNHAQDGAIKRSEVWSHDRKSRGRINCPHC